MSQERYTHMQHNIRKHFKLSMEEYAVLDAIYCLSRSQACDAKPEYFVDLFDISRRTYFNICKSLSDKNLIVKTIGGVKTTLVWDDAMAGRVAPWTDPSAEKEPAPVKETPLPEEKIPENNDSAKIALCENCLKIVQNLHSEEIESAEFALKLCKICTEAVQNLHSTGAKFALHNIDINIDINNNINNKDLEPVGSTPYHKIDKIFQAGSEALTGSPYYRDKKEAKHIKLLESRYIVNPEAFINLTRKYYLMLTKLEDDFWSSQAFTPSAFNSHYNRILCFQLPSGMKKQEEQKARSEWDVLMDQYGHYDIEKLKYLQRGGTITQRDIDYILEQRKLEVSA